MTTVAVIAANGLQRAGLRGLLVEQGFEVVMEAGTAAEVIERGTAAPVDVVLFDATACTTVTDDLKDLRGAALGACILLLADSFDGTLLREALSAGADGCLTADMSSNVLAEWIRYGLAGGRVFPRGMAEILQRPAAPSSTAIGGRMLSPREAEVLSHLVDGSSNKAIANQLGVTEATVKIHLKGLLRKINAANRTQAAIWALSNGIPGAKAKLSSSASA